MKMLLSIGYHTYLIEEAKAQAALKALTTAIEVRDNLHKGELLTGNPIQISLRTLPPKATIRKADLAQLDD
jgi:hypothetical protein